MSVSEITKVEWWLAECSAYPTLHWARLRIFTDDKADILFENGDESYGFENSEFASYFLLEDEFIRFDTLDEEYRKSLEIPESVKIQIPDWENKEVKNFKYIGKY